MARRVAVIKKTGEGSAMDRRFDRAHPGLKEGSRGEEAFDRRMTRKPKKSGRRTK